MKVLFLLGWPLDHGGHINSSICLGKQLIRLGCHLFLAAPDGPKKIDFGKHGFKIFVCNTLTKKSPRNLMAVPSLIDIVLKEKIDVIHAMDYQSLYAGFIVASLFGRQFVYTKAGGETPTYNIPAETNTIVYSQELLNGMKLQYPYLANRLHLIKARIDTELFRPLEMTNIHPEDDVVNIFMAMRFAEQKRPWLETAISGISKLADEKSSFTFCLAGGGELWREIKIKIDGINHRYNREVIRLLGAISDTNEMNRLYNNADIIIGHGRGIMEAMACGKPVIALGKHHDVTLVSKETVEKISNFNFSGRHIDCYSELSQDFVEVLVMLLERPSIRLELQKHSLAYIENEYSAKIGARLLKHIYESNKIKIYIRYYYLLKLFHIEAGVRIKRFYIKLISH